MNKTKDVDRLYQNYVRYQAGDKSALDEVFMEVGKNVGETMRIVELEEEYKLSHTENVLDAGLMQDEIEHKQKERKLKVVFAFPCLNRMVSKAKYEYSKNGKFTGYENGKKINSGGYKKFHSGKYDTLELEEVMQEIVIKLFQGRLSGSNIDITDGVAFLRNIKYYLSKEIGNYNEVLVCNIPETYIDTKDGEERSYFDQYSKLIWMQSENKMSRILPYSEYFEWMRRNDVRSLFKANASDIGAIIETIMNREDTFIRNRKGKADLEIGMRLATQKTLQEIIKCRHGINIEQENISKDLELIEQRLLDHLFYSLNYRIGKAAKSEGIYDKESERCLYELDKKAYVKMFNRAGYEIYEKSIRFIDGELNGSDFDHYFNAIKKYEGTVLSVVSKEKGKKKYDMVNLISDNDYDLVDDKTGALLNIAYAMISFYQKRENEYRRNHFGEYKMKGLKDWKNGVWEADLQNENLDIKLWSSKNIKKPIERSINKERLMVYCGYRNFYFCDVESIICYSLPKEKRIITRANKNHEIFMYDAG